MSSFALVPVENIPLSVESTWPLATFKCIGFQATKGQTPDLYAEAFIEVHQTAAKAMIIFRNTILDSLDVELIREVEKKFPENQDAFPVFNCSSVVCVREDLSEQQRAQMIQRKVLQEGGLQFTKTEFPLVKSLTFEVCSPIGKLFSPENVQSLLSFMKHSISGNFPSVPIQIESEQKN